MDSTNAAFMSRTVRESLGISQEDLAMLLGVHQPDISRLEGPASIPLAPLRQRRLEGLYKLVLHYKGVYKLLVTEAYEFRLQFDPQLTP